MAKKKSVQPIDSQATLNGPDESLSFEQAVRQLESIVDQLENRQTGLDESLRQYEQGVRLLQNAYRMLDVAERRIEMLSSVDQQGRPILKPVDESTMASDTAQPGRASRAAKQAPAKRRSSPSDAAEPDIPFDVNPIEELDPDGLI